MFKVSVPYEITLLSNTKATANARTIVSVPYEITLLSNRNYSVCVVDKVSVPYEITLLSNYAREITLEHTSFSTL